MSPEALIFVQDERRGTAHAVRQAEAAFADAKGNVIVLYADTPLVSADTVAAIHDQAGWEKSRSALIARRV